MLNVLSKFTTHYRAVLSRSYELGTENGSGVITPADLLKALLEQKGSVGCEILSKTKKAVEVDTPIAVIDRPSVSSSVTVSPEVASIIEKSVLVAAKWTHQYVGTEHLLASLYEVLGAQMNALLEGTTFELDALKMFLSQVLKGVSKYSDEAADSIPNHDEHVEVNSSKRPARRRKTKTEALDYFGIDLTNKRVEKELDPVVGRESEINRIIQILGRRTKNNPILLGEPGVGKTAIVEGLAKRIASGNVPDQLMNKRIYQLDLTLMVAGSMYRGEFEQRLKQTLDEVKANPDIIVFIDEIHTIVGAGSVGNSMDASNILKPALARGQVRCIGATTYDEYKRHIESDPALERRFQPIHVQELSMEQSIEVLKGIRKGYEKHHGITIGDDAIEAAITLSTRYVPEKRLPDKAIDVIDEASSRSALLFGQDARLRGIRECERKLLDVRERKQDAVKKEQFPLALELKRQEEELSSRQMFLQAEVDLDSTRGRRVLTRSDIVAVISEMTKIPVGELQVEERMKFENIQNFLEQEIFGQSDVLADIVGYVKRARSGLSGRERPLGSFLFLGPTGVGKTETARVIAKTMFGSPDRLVRVDMSEFGEAFTVSRLIGSPAGYVGFREGGMLTEAIRRNPYSVILFDEIEKAHPDVFNVLLQVFDAGHLSDSAGKKVNFKNTIIVMTSNLGMKALNESAKIGFTAESVKGGMQALEQSFNEQKQEALFAIRKFFRPEFLNRLDKIAVFRPLTQSALLKIAEKELNNVSRSLVDQKIGFSWVPEVAELLTRGFDPAEGGRVVVRNVHEKLENELADRIIAGTLKSGSSVSLGINNDTIQFIVSEGIVSSGSKAVKARKPRAGRVKEKVVSGVESNIISTLEPN